MGLFWFFFILLGGLVLSVGAMVLTIDTLAYRYGPVRAIFIGALVFTALSCGSIAGAMQFVDDLPVERAVVTCASESGAS